MNHYLDIQLRPDPELVPHQLFAALYRLLHRGLVAIDSNDIGASFPGYDLEQPSLGERLRLHGSELSLQRLMATDWLKTMRDHLKLGKIEPVPAVLGHRLISRAQVNNNPERLRRRAIKRHGLSEEAALQRIPDSVGKRLSLPFVMLGSASTRQAAFPLFIRLGPLLEQPTAGCFNSYGLSREASVPWF